MKIAIKVFKLDSNFLIDKNRYYEKKFGIGFLIFLRRFISADVREKGGTNEKSAHSPVCMRKSIGSLYLTPLFTAFEKM